jgi:hypothetical protein
MILCNDMMPPWPAQLVTVKLLQHWYLGIAAAIIELYILGKFLKYSWKKSTIITLTGNVVSYFFGTLMMLYGMALWYKGVNFLIPHEPFGTANWTITYILMCLGSVLLEARFIQMIYTVGFKQIFLPLLAGNALVYIIIALESGAPPPPY